MSPTPAWPGYLADPFVQRTAAGYLAIGTEDPAPEEGELFPVLASPDLRDWRAVGHALRRPAPELGDAFWAPEIVERDGAWWLYYSVGRGIVGHRIRVARADAAEGPYDDLGIELTPRETFAIDAHPFRDDDGSWYLFFARDVLDAEPVGTHLAVARMASPVALAGETVPVLEPYADWQLYERGRRMYGRELDWHTLEGPSVVRRHGRY
ncbi:MAG: family 43 glycosylhydrolase, partial [Protaetiibacter sp.]